MLLAIRTLKRQSMANPGVANSGEEATIKVASKKEEKEKPKGTIKLKKPQPKPSKLGVWLYGNSTDGEDVLLSFLLMTAERTGES